MDKCHDSVLPFEVGQLIEAKSFQRGYRGAWFKCKIKEINRKNKQLFYALEYVDFPDEKVKWTKVYQKPPTYNSKSREVKKELMVRPTYPPIYHENKAPKTISEVVIFVNNLWKVEDLVDCWIDGCHWSGKVTNKLGGDKVEIDLMPNPIGEGLTYKVCLKDLRPSLDWSPQHGWMLPVPQVGRNKRCCGRVIHPEGGATTAQENDGELTKRSSNSEFLIAHTNGKTLDTPATLNINVKETFIANEVICARQKKKHRVEENTITGERKRSYSDSCNVTKDVSDEEQTSPERGNLGPALSMLPENNDLREGIRLSEKKFSPCEESSVDIDLDTPEAALLHLVELASKVKWLKGILISGSSLSTSDAIKPDMKNVENRATTSSK